MNSIKKSWGINPIISFVFPVVLMMTDCLVLAQQEESASKVFRKHSGPVKALAFSPDGKTVATGGDDKMIYFWDIQTGELTGHIENSFSVKVLQFAAGNRILAACGSDIKLMDGEGNLLRTYGGYTTDIWSVSYQQALQRIVAGSYSKNIRVWDFESGKAVLTLEGHEKSCLPVCFSPRGNLIASGSLDKSVRIWDAVTGQQRHKMELHTENIFALDFHPSGKYVASASADKTIRLWNAETGEILRTYAGHTGAVFEVRFSADGNHLISCSADRTLILWEMATGRKLYTFTGHTGMVNAVRYSVDNSFIASVSDDQSMRLWKLEKKCFVESFYQKEIDQAVVESGLFIPRRNDETRQDYTEREKKAASFLQDLYEEYYKRYSERIKLLSPEDKTLQQ